MYCNNPSAAELICGIVLQVGLQGKGALVAGLKIVHRRSRRVCSLRKIPLPLQRRWYRRELIERIVPVLAVEIDEIKSLGPAVVDMRNIQRPAHGPAETILQIRRLFRRRAGELIW